YSKKGISCISSITYFCSRFVLENLSFFINFYKQKVINSLILLVFFFYTLTLNTYSYFVGALNYIRKSLYLKAFLLDRRGFVPSFVPKIIYYFS
ncbi:TPA: hypothetical protein ACQ0AB_001775, partial [Streptococcus agalactiae]|uniref:hypothetical protein n=3 Tax=Streptococcus agalactiae TaxID=1311 RepID=UPI001E3924B4